MVEEKYNRKNPAVKRILQEVKEMQTNPSDDFMALPLEENIFEWQFAICGPRDSEFAGGIYHGRIQLPSEYPLKPPAFMLLTPNGRFETQTKICLSISNHHPEHWQPSWSVRTALVALIAFMPTNPDGALGSLDFKKEERRALAIKSREVIPKYGTTERQKLIEEIHQYMLTKAPPVSQLEPTPETNQSASTVVAEDNAIAAVEETTNPVMASEAGAEIVEEVHQVQVNANAGRLRVRFAVGVGQRITEPRIERQQEMAEEVPQRNELLQQKNVAAGRGSTEDRLYTLAAMGLTAAILILLLKKYLKSVGFAGFEGGSQE